MIFAFPSCTDLRNLNFSTFPPPHSLFFPGLFLICISYPIWFTVGLCEQLNGLSGRAGNKGTGKERRGRMEEELQKPTFLLRQMSVYAFRWKAFYISWLLRVTLLLGSVLGFKNYHCFWVCGTFNVCLNGVERYDHRSVRHICASGIQCI